MITNPKSQSDCWLMPGRGGYWTVRLGPDSSAGLAICSVGLPSGNILVDAAAPFFDDLGDADRLIAKIAARNAESPSSSEPTTSKGSTT